MGVGDDSEVTRLTGGGGNFFCVPEEEGSMKDDGLAKGWFFGEPLTVVKNPLAEDMSTSPPNV